MKVNRTIPETVGTVYSDGASGHVVLLGQDTTTCGEHAVRELRLFDPNEPICPECGNGVPWSRLGG